MSKIDEDFVRGLGISASEIARILSRSRQTVSRGLKVESDYFTVSELKNYSGTGMIEIQISKHEHVN